VCGNNRRGNALDFGDLHFHEIDDQNGSVFDDDFAASGLPAEPSAAGLDFFEQHIRPVLADRCHQCHSARAEEKLKGDLMLDCRHYEFSSARYQKR
jgi:hypothetical protein